MPNRRHRVIAAALVLLVALSAHASIQISGLNQVSEDDAKELIAAQSELVETNGGSRPLADDASFFLERGLRDKGYKDADVQWDFNEATKGITLRVDEGPGQTIGEITVSGNTAAIPKEDAAGDDISDGAITDDDIRSLVRRRTSNRLRSTILAKDEALPYVEEEISRGLSDVTQLYRSFGYWKAETAPLEKSITVNGNNVDIHVQIKPGELQRFKAFQFVGDTGGNTAELTANLTPLIGKPCSTENVTAARAEVTDFFSSRGYFKLQIEATPKEEGNQVTIIFDIDAGAAFNVTGIHVKGNERVKTEFLKNRFAPLVGKPYSPTQADEIYRELLGVGLFKRISVSPEESPPGDNVDLVVTVEEAKSRSVSVFGGFGTYEGGILGFNFRENNVFGTGRQFDSTVEITQRGLSGALEYSDLWFYNTPYYWNAKLFGLSQEREGYTILQYGGRVEIGRDFGDHYSVSAFASLSLNDITDADIEDDNLGLQNYRIGTIGLAQTWDMRDSPTLPSRGFIFDNTIEYANGALASEVDFVRGTVRFTKYIPVTKNTRLSLGARSGFLIPTGDNKDEGVPIDQRFFSGGSTSVRSFRERDLGDRDRRGFPLGGEFYTTFNAEYSVAVGGGLRVAVFGDAGNLLSDVDDAGFDDMHYAVGAGLRYDLPTGPIRVDYGYNANKGAREPSGTLHISIGVAF